MTPPRDGLEERAKEYYDAAGFLIPSHNYLRNFASIELQALREEIKDELQIMSCSCCKRALQIIDERMK